MEKKKIKEEEKKEKAAVVVDEEKEKNNKKVMLLIIGVATLLVALIGATFAYFTALINRPNGEQSVAVTTTTVQGVVYTASDAIALENALPGDHAESTFTIYNPNESAVAQYTLVFYPVSNSFTNEAVDDPSQTLDNQLVLTVSGGQLVGTLTHDFTNGEDSSNWTVVEDVSLNAKATDTYNVRIDFFNLDANQDNNQGDHFAGHFDVSQKVVASNAG